MDIISYNKASKVFKEVTDLDEGVVTKGAESHFESVDARLDWIEGQVGVALGTNSLDVDLSRQTFQDTEFVSGAIQLKSIGPKAYLSSGVWESEVIDLGEGWQKTRSITMEVK